MTAGEAAKILAEHNAWRRYNSDDSDNQPSPAPPDVRLVGIAIDVAVKHLDAVQQWADATAGLSEAVKVFNNLP